MIPRRVSRLARCIVVLAAVLLAGAGPAMAIAHAWRSMHGSAHVAALTVAPPASHAIAFVRVQRRAHRPLTTGSTSAALPSSLASLTTLARAAAVESTSRHELPRRDGALPQRTRAPPLV